MRVTTKGLVAAVLAMALIGGGVAVAQREAEDVNGRKHVNLLAAQKLTQQAREKLTTAQHANEWDTQGHAGKAKEALEEASKELQLAIESANKNPR